MTRIIAIGGGTCSGKSTAAPALQRALGEDNCAVIRHDDYYLPDLSLTFEELKAYNYDHPDALQTDLLVFHLERLMSGEAVEVPKYNFAKHARRPKKEWGDPVLPTPFIIVEGILVLHEERIRQLCERTIFVDTPAEVRFARRVFRDTHERGRTEAEVYEQWNTTVHPMHLQFSEPSKKYADIIIPEGGKNEQADNVIRLLVETLLSQAA